MDNPYSSYGFAKRIVGNNELVSNQLNRLTAQNGRYVGDARQRALGEAGRRGLTNSSLAAAGAEGAAIQAALPIASQDASAYRTAADMESGNAQQTSISNAQIAAQERSNAASAASASAYASSAAAERDADRRWNDQRDIRNRGWSVEDRNFGDKASVRDRDAGYSYGRENRDSEQAYGRENRDSTQAYGRENREAGFANDQVVRNDTMFANFIQPFADSIAGDPNLMANPEAMGGFFDFIGGTGRRVIGAPRTTKPSGSVAKRRR